MKNIKLNSKLGEFYAIVDEDDFESLLKFSWFAQRGRNGAFYAARKDKNNKQIYMHRQILMAKAGYVVDHANSNTLDNRKENLRTCLSKENLRNRHIDKRNKTGFKGVQLDPRKNLSKRYMAQMTLDGKSIYLGRFETPEQAALAYNEAALKHHGEFARLNEL